MSIFLNYVGMTVTYRGYVKICGKRTLIFHVVGLEGLQPVDAGWEGMVVAVLWEHHRMIRDEWRKRQAWFPHGTSYAGSVNISLFAHDWIQRGRPEFSTPMRAWRSLSDEDRQEWMVRIAQQREEDNRLWRQEIRRHGYPEITEVSMDETQGPNRDSIVWRYVQHLCVLAEGQEPKEDASQQVDPPEEEDREDDQEEEEVEEDPFYQTATFRVVLSDNRYLPLEDFEFSTAFFPEPADPPPAWTTDLHWRFPAAFRKRVFQILLVLMRPGTPFYMIGKDVTLGVIRALAARAWEEEEEQDWE